MDYADEAIEAAWLADETARYGLEAMELAADATATLASRRGIPIGDAPVSVTPADVLELSVRAGERRALAAKGEALGPEVISRSRIRATSSAPSRDSSKAGLPGTPGRQCAPTSSVMPSALASP